MCVVTHWNCPLPGPLKNPAVRSFVVKSVLPDCPITSMHSWASFMEYLSSRDLAFSAGTSWTSHREPFFFMTQNTRLLNLDLHG